MSNYIAHRGLKDNLKENSLEAFIKACNNDNYDGFECDVRQTKDNILVIHHNFFKGVNLIKNLTSKELKKEQIPLLKDVLKIKTDKIILLELKDFKIDILYLNNLLNKYANKRIYVMSFYRSIIKKLSKLTRTYKVGVLNYVLNSEEDYKEYDFICLLEKVYSTKLYEYFYRKNIEVFIYGIKNETTYSIKDKVYLITDKIVK